ncbi:MAG: glycosyltransferase family 2 protein [Candidatus Heimdallarchaeota archaeon]
MDTFIPDFRVAAIIPVWKNEEIFSVLEKFDQKYVHEVIIVLDEPDDYYLTKLKEIAKGIPPSVKVIENPERMGIGFAISKGLYYAHKSGYEAIIVMAGNGKDDPREIPRLTQELANGYDYIQGSRFLKGGKSVGLPIIRRIFNRLWPAFWTIITFRKQTEVTNGFRAYRLEILSDPKINIDQEWLKGYALEYYIHYKIITSKEYKFKEVPVSKIYTKRKDYTKIQPMNHWNQIIMPPILLFFRIKK